MRAMSPTFQTYLTRWQRRYGDALLTLLTCLLLLLMFVVAPLQAAGVGVVQDFGFIVMLLMMAGAMVVSGSPTPFAVMLVALCMYAWVIVHRLHGASNVDISLVAGAWLLLAGALGWVVIRAVFGPGRVNYHRVIGAVLLYLLIALTFVALFAFVGLLIPNAFSGIALQDSPALTSNLIYFSFVTLTSTGYGDIVPMHPVARSLCNLETVIGQLYPATVLARLVTLQLAHKA
jgi:Ion channel